MLQMPTVLTPSLETQEIRSVFPVESQDSGVLSVRRRTDGGVVSVHLREFHEWELDTPNYSIKDVSGNSTNRVCVDLFGVVIGARSSLGVLGHSV